jgi:protein phosphatase
MGVILPKPIMSKVIERVGNEHVNGAVCSINGFRNAMEDAHVMLLAEDRMIFGVFDGHSNDRCSAFIGDKLPERMRALPLPVSDEALEAMCLDLDEQFLEDYGDGGTTATFCMVEPQRGGIEYAATICNVGDSRTFIIRKGELLFVTEDHKPQDAGEKERIIRCGGTVRMGRVDGDLAVSRAFGDGAFKKNRDDPRQQKVICVPDVTRLTILKDDILMIACDGVFEGAFPTPDVVDFVKRQFPPVNGDMAIVAAKVVDQAVRAGSKDNITCMCISFTNGSDVCGPPTAFVPGAPFARSHDGSRNVYAKMARMADLTLGEALEARYKMLVHHLAGTASQQPAIMQLGFEMSDDAELESEKLFFGSGPPPNATEDQSRAWFNALADGQMPM